MCMCTYFYASVNAIAAFCHILPFRSVAFCHVTFTNNASHATSPTTNPQPPTPYPLSPNRGPYAPRHLQRVRAYFFNNFNIVFASGM